MKNKEKKKLNGEVRTYNMYTTILNWSEWQTKDTETQKQLMTKWREIYPNAKIMEDLSLDRPTKFNSQSYNDLIKALGCPPKQKSFRSKNKRTAKSKIATATPQISLEFEETEPENQIEQKIKDDVVKTLLITNGLHLEYNGTYDAESLNRLFTKLQLLIDGELNKFNISLSLSETDD